MNCRILSSNFAFIFASFLVFNVTAIIYEEYFKVHAAKQLSMVFDTFQAISKIGCTYKCISRDIVGTCTGANYNKVTRACSLSNDTTQTLTTTGVTQVVAILLTKSATQSGINDCYDVLNKGIGSESGVYTVVTPGSQETINVYCDMVTDGGGWTVFQYRHNDTVDFYRTFNEYENGFGDLNGEFWLGLKYIQEMTAGTASSDVHITFVDVGNTIVYEKLSNFYHDADKYYTLHVADVNSATDGTPSSLEAGGSFYYNNGYGFSTYDKGLQASCATQHHSGFWFISCTWINPNGHYAPPGTQSEYQGGWGGVIHYSWQLKKSMKSTKLMFRRNG